MIIFPQAGVESGVWTPALQDVAFNDQGQTYLQQVGKYTRIGDRVLFDGRIDMSSLGTLNPGLAAFIGGLPYPVSTDAAAEGAVVIGETLNIGIAATDLLVVGVFHKGGSAFSLRNWESTRDKSVMVLSDVSANATIAFSGHYSTDAP